MTSILRIAVPILAVLTVAPSQAEEKAPGTGYTGKISALSIPADALGPDWTGPTGLIVDDFQKLDTCPPEVRPMAEVLQKQLSPLGVVGCADFTYRKKSTVFGVATLRLFVFDSDKSCDSWCKKKYGYEGWQQHYTVVDGMFYKAVDSTQVTKRALWYGNLWMTCHTLDKSANHLKVIDLYLNKIKALSEAEKAGGRKP